MASSLLSARLCSEAMSLSFHGNLLMAKLNNNCTSDSVSLANCGDRDWSRQGFSDFVVALRCRWVLCWLLLLLLQDDVAVVVVVDKCILQSHTHSLTHSLARSLPAALSPFALVSCPAHTVTRLK